MKTTGNQIFLLKKISYYLFILLIIAVPLALYRSFDNGLEFVKSEVLKIIGGLFIIVSSLFFIFSYNGKGSERNKIIFNKTLDPFVILFIISAVFSVLFSIDFRTSYNGSYERQIGLLTYLYLFLIYILLPFIINNKERIKMTMLLMEAAAVLVALMCILEYAGISILDLRPYGFKRPVSTIGHPIFSAGFMMLIFPFSVLNVSSKKSKILRFAVPSAIAAGIIATQTRTAYVALGVEMLIIAVLYSLTSKEKRAVAKKKYIRFLFILLAFTLLFTVSALLFPENAFIKRILSISKIYEQPRWLLWRDSVSMFTHYLFTGTGIGVFSRAFENFASYELRYSEIRVYFDNAHNNFINTFCTMGLFGGITYLLLLLQVLRISLRNLLSPQSSNLFKIYSLAFLAFISGYIVFGLADFDDINILFYLFVLLFLFKAVNRNFGIRSGSFKEISPDKKIIFSIASIFIVFSIYSIYTSFNEISAQEFFSGGLERYSAGDIDGFMRNVENAIKLNPYEPYYKYDYASKINIYCSGLTKNDAVTKYKLLEKAKEQVIKAEVNNSSRLNCLSLRSLIELGLGEEQEAFRIKDELFKIDSTVISYRINLAVYYLNQNNDSAAIKELNTVLSWDIKNVNAFTAKTMYFLKTGNNSEAEKTCREILAIEPGNSFAERTLKEINLNK